MKKNMMMRIASVLLVAVLLSTCVIGGTFAKYATEATGTATATVATWNIDLNDTDMNTFTFNLFDTLKDSDKTNDETDVDTDAKVIAPGTSGSFQIKLANNSQVNAGYEVEIETPQNFPTSLTFDYTSTGTLAMDAETTITVNWVWAFTEEVENSYAGQSFNVTAKVTVSQVD